MLGLSAAALVSMLGPAAAQAETAAVGIADLRFTPDATRAQMVQGEAAYPEAHAHVRWVNDELVAEHTVTFDDTGLTSSDRLAPGDTFEVVLPVAGTFTYRCTIHPAMKGTLVALAPGTAAEATPEAKTSGPPGLLLVAALLAGIAAVTVALRRRRGPQL